MQVVKLIFPWESTKGFQSVRRAKTISDLTERVEVTPLRLLTRREREVIALVAQGCANDQIAGQLGISVGTVKWHLVRIYRKLNVSNRMQAALCAQALTPSRP